jgi:hypothetical protein
MTEPSIPWDFGEMHLGPLATPYLHSMIRCLPGFEPKRREIQLGTCTSTICQMQ